MAESLIERRIGDLRAFLLEQADGPLHFIMVICDGCGVRIQLPPDEPRAWERMLAGWTLDKSRPYTDLCPICAPYRPEHRPPFVRFPFGPYPRS